MTHTLDYVRPTPWYKKRTTRHALFWFFIACLLTIMIYFGPTAWRRIKILYYQDACMYHSDDPADVVVTLNFEKGIAGAPAVDSKNFLDALGPAGRGTYLVAGSALPLSREGRVFLHARTSKGGTRLITVDFDAVYDPIGPLGGWYGGDPRYGNVAFCASVIKPGTLTADPQFISDDRCIIYRDIIRNDPMLNHEIVVYAGQPDPADDAAFTVRYTAFDVPYVARLRLSDAADKVEFISNTMVAETIRF